MPGDSRNARNALTPDALALVATIARTGSFAAAARELGVVPSALTSRVRQIEDALDVLLFDRSARQARITAAGDELLREGARLLADIDAIAHRIRRVATGWEPALTIAVDSIVPPAPVMELVASFFALAAPTRLRLLTETLSGTLEALASGAADLAIGVVHSAVHAASGLQREPVGQVRYVFAVAPHHPLAGLPDPLAEDVIRAHRAVAVADSARSGKPLTIGLLAGQDVFTVASMPAKLDAQLRGLGAGFLPMCLAQPYIDAGRLVVKSVDRPFPEVLVGYAWRSIARARPSPALRWWLEQLRRPVTRNALLGVRSARRK